MFPRLLARATFVADTTFVSGTQKCFRFCSETFCVRNKCFPVCAAQETSWATMCPRLPGPLNVMTEKSAGSSGYLTLCNLG